MQPAVSVLTATWNRAPFLEGALRSVLAQEFENWEHLVIDDGSSDQTPELLTRLSHSRLRVFRTENRGQAEALNLGLRESRGEWIAFLDSDDEYKPNHLSSLMGGAENLDLLLARFELVNCTGNPEPRCRDFYRPGHEIALKDIEVITGALFVRRKLALELGGFRSVPSTDTDFYQRAARHGARARRLQEPTYRYYFGRDGKSQALHDLAQDKNQGES